MYVWLGIFERQQNGNDDSAVIHTIDETQYPIMQHPIVISIFESKNTNI